MHACSFLVFERDPTSVLSLLLRDSCFSLLFRKKKNNHRGKIIVILRRIRRKKKRKRKILDYYFFPLKMVKIIHHIEIIVIGYIDR